MHQQTSVIMRARVAAAAWTLAAAAGIGAGVAVTPPLYADIEVGPTIDVRRGPDPLSAGLLSGSLPANFLDVRPDNLYAGLTSAGELRIFSGVLGTGVLQNANGFVGHDATADGQVIVEGGGIWSNEDWTVGKAGTGTVDVMTAGLVGFSGVATIGDEIDSMGTVTVNGMNSKINSNTAGDLTVGKAGTGFLHIQNQGAFTDDNGFGVIGDTSTGVGTVTVDGTGSLLEMDFLLVGNFGEGSLDISGGGIVRNSAIRRVGAEPGSQGDVTVDGAGSRWEGGSLDIGHDGGTGTLAITDGAVVESTGFDFNIGDLPGSTGVATVDGVGSRLETGGVIRVGYRGANGSLEVSNEASVIATNVTIGVSAEGNNLAEIIVDGPGSTMEVSSAITVGLFGMDGTMRLDVRNGAFVSAEDLAVKFDLGLNLKGRVIVQSGGELRVEDQASFDSTPTLADGTISFGGSRVFDPGGGSLGSDVNGVLVPRSGVLGLGERLKVDGQLSVLSPIVIDGGGLSAGSIPSLGLVDLVRGTLELTAVDVDVTDPGPFGDTIALNADQHLKIGQTVHVLGDGRVDLAGGRLGAGLLSNDGVVQGDGRVDGPLQNNAGGEVRTDPGQSLLFTGAGNVNDGEINLQGGATVLGATVEFEQDLTNTATGRIFGRGVFIANGGLTNEGEMVFSGGFTDVHGPVTMTGGVGTIISTSAGVTTFLDDVDHNGEFIRTSADSVTTFLGDVTGSGPYTGTGTVNFEAGFSPGSSPGDVSFEGGLTLGDLSVFTLEIGGRVQGVEYDHVNVQGSLRAGGRLEVALIDGFSPSLGDRFDLLDFASAAGAFDAIRLPELHGGLAFDASSLLTTGAVAVVPEPGMAGVLALSAFGIVRRRKVIFG